ncbi:MAG TPA: DUF1206 domain-containing protein [Thermoflexales bacterium]|nr:DUF1206 domain-containing protein [Anaerolineae bacterium]HQV27786.1 DUF1206 domain-containing protein [Thermoflexales bacterium]HQX09713.1 DUF1206 domain-containing protein [Thermoflexales bacterium]HQY24048.1 DUF1206 domain-containing protein [Thermoflexales bacterium]HQZ53062.1 DUF1206 domain-containing protein [Thermoflexales bacterium]
MGASESRQSLKQRGRQVAHATSTSTGMENLARFGYVVRGLVYVVIGALALQVALGGGGALTDPQGAIAVIGKSLPRAILLYGILVGLVGYSLWGFIRAILDPLHKGNGPRGALARIGYALSGVSYVLLVVATYGLITGGAAAASSGAQTAQAQKTAATLLAQSGGAYAVAGVAILITAVGIIQIIAGVRRKFDEQKAPNSLPSGQKRWMVWVSQFGFAARGAVFALIGVFLFSAAYTHDASKAQGIDGVLEALLAQPAGPWLLGVVALGLIAFGFYSVMSGVWLRLRG